MASTTIASLSTVLKEVYTSETLKKQFYDDNPVLAKIRQVTGTVIGRQATVPIQTGANGGYTSVGPNGGSLNPAGAPGVSTATYTLVYNWMQIAIEDAVLNQSNGGSTSVVDAVDFTMQDAIQAMSRQISRQLVGDGTGFIAQCATTTASTTLLLAPAGRGANAIARNHLRVGLPIDIGTTADSDSQASGVFITDVNPDPAAPSLTLSSAVTAGATHFVSIANPNSVTATNTELNGFRNIAGSNTTPLGGIDPAVAGNGFWKPAVVDSTAAVWSIAKAAALQQSVFQNTGKFDVQVFTSPKQATAMYTTLQNQVRFAGEMNMGAGGVGGLVGLSWNGQGINVMPDIYDSDWFLINLADLVRVTGAMKDPTWVSETEGRGKSLGWSQGTTQFVDGVRWPFQIGAARRNTHAAAVALS